MATLNFMTTLSNMFQFTPVLRRATLTLDLDDGRKVSIHARLATGDP